MELRVRVHCALNLYLVAQLVQVKLNANNVNQICFWAKIHRNVCSHQIIVKLDANIVSIKIVLNVIKELTLIMEFAHVIIKISIY